MTHEQPKDMNYWLQACGMTDNAGQPADSDIPHTISVSNKTVDQPVHEQQTDLQPTIPYEPISPNRPSKLKYALVAGATLVATLAIARGCDSNDASPVSGGANNPEQVSGSGAVCGNTWAVHELDNTGHRIISTGIESIKTAQTPEEARAAAGDYLETVKGDPDVLVANAKLFLNEDVSRDSLVDGNSCMTPQADQLVNSLAIAFGESEITPDQAPANGVNTGVNSDGTVVESVANVITGDRKAIKIERVTKDENGKEIVNTVWIMSRCGNPVTEKSGSLPTGPTDNNYRPPTTEHYTDTTTTIHFPPKYDHGRLSGNPDVPADQDKGTPDIPGDGDAGQTPGPDGYLPQETRPQAPSTTRPYETQPPTTIGRPPATTTPPPRTTNPPVTATTSESTTVPQDKPRPTQP